MTGKVVAITGANSGIGLATAEALARRGATIARRTDRLDALIRNAGMATDRRTVTEDGFESTFAVNALAPFVLTTELLPLLTASAPARVITVSSALHATVRSLDLDDLRSTKGYRWSNAYARAKLAALLFSNELARRLVGTGVTSNALHPGMIATGFGGDGDVGGANALLFRVLNRFVPGPEVGARTSLHLATAPDLDGVTGRYFKMCAERAPSAWAQDETLAKDLWARIAQAVST